MDRRNLVPVHVELDARPLRVHWLDVAGLEVPRVLTHERLRDLVVAHPRRLRATTLRVSGAASAASTRPIGLLVHLSRCGSTLAANLLGAAPDATVLVEPEALNAVLVDPTLTGEERRALVILMLEAAALIDGRPRGVVKLTSWNALFLAELRAAVPAGRALFLFREPVEVLASLERRWPRWLERDGEAATSLAGRLVAQRGVTVANDSPRPRRHNAGCELVAPRGVTVADDTALAEAAGLLRAIAEAALAEPRSALPMLAYDALPAAAWTHLFPALLGRDATAQEVTAMRALATHNAKRPSLGFVADAAAKRQQATPQARSHAEALEDLHARLLARAAATSEPWR